MARQRECPWNEHPNERLGAICIKRMDPGSIADTRHLPPEMVPAPLKVTRTAKF
jgi:hypothetical protein